MEGVLVLITIPTKAEEARLKADHQPKTQLSSRQDHGIDIGLPGNAYSGIWRSAGVTQIDMDTESESSVTDIFESSRTDGEHKKSSRRDTGLPVSAESCMELVVREILKKFQVATAVWSTCNEGRLRHVNFNMEMDEAYKQMLMHLKIWGIGNRPRSSVSITNCTHWQSQAKNEKQESEEKEEPEVLMTEQNLWERFAHSVQSRANIGKIVGQVRQDASMTFDFFVLLISATILSCFGLEEDSLILLISSMLVSPLMGPIIAGIFGTAIRDRSLCLLGIRNEVIGLLIATLGGLGFGFVKCLTDDRYGSGEGVTAEMLARCDLHSLLIGTIAAIPSGAAVAIGILAGNISSLVGVAISASLLPPAVNAGVLWSLAAIYKLYEHDKVRYTRIVDSRRYSSNPAVELVVLGSISFCLTLFNIVFVYLVGLLVLKIKEVAPAISANQRDFWQRDIKIARHLSPVEGDSDEAVINVFTNLPEEDQHTLVMDCELLAKMCANKENYQQTWSPSSTNNCYIRERLYPSLCRQYNTIHHFDWQTTNKSAINLIRRPTVRLIDVNASCQLLKNDAAQPTSEANTLKHSSDVGQRRAHRFIVTPAKEPLLNHSNSNEYEV